MPRESTISSADAANTCSICLGAGQVKDISDSDENFVLITCPFCSGLGRVSNGRGNTKALKRYNASQARKRKALDKSKSDSE